MDLLEAQVYGQNLINTHLGPQVKFVWSNAARMMGQARKRRVGYTRWGDVVYEETIRVSCKYVSVNDTQFLHNLLLHEIAHFKAGLHTGHGYAFRQACRELGVREEACWNHKVDGFNAPTPTYTARCPQCGQEYHKFRRPTRNRSCGPCSRGTYNPAFLLVWEKGGGK